MWDELALKMLQAIIDNTTIDDQAWELIANQVKAGIPGDNFEPILGTAFIEIGKRLQEPAA